MTAVYTHTSATENGPTGASTDLTVSSYSTLLLLVTVSALSGIQPIVSFAVDSKDGAGNYYQIYSSAGLNEPDQIVCVSIGPGCEVPTAFGDTVRVRWEISDQGHGTDTPTATFYAQLLGK